MSNLVTARGGSCLTPCTSERTAREERSGNRSKRDLFLCLHLLLTSWLLTLPFNKYFPNIDYMLGLGVQRCVPTAPVLRKLRVGREEGSTGKSTVTAQGGNAAVGEGQDTVEIPKGQETSELRPLGGTRIAGQERRACHH